MHYFRAINKLKNRKLHHEIIKFAMAITAGRIFYRFIFDKKIIGSMMNLRIRNFVNWYAIAQSKYPYRDSIKTKFHSLGNKYEDGQNRRNMLGTVRGCICSLGLTTHV
jgi:hypothetical protein